MEGEQRLTGDDAVARLRVHLHPGHRLDVVLLAGAAGAEPPGRDPDGERVHSADVAVALRRDGVLVLGHWQGRAGIPALRGDLDMERVRAFADEKQDVFLLPDQDILTALYGDRVHLLDSMVYNLSDRILALHNAQLLAEPVDLDWVRMHTVIIHYCGRLKPWKPHYVGVLDVFYHELMEEIQK